MKHLYETDGDNYNGYSYLLYMFMTMVMQTISAMPAEACKKYLAELKEKGLFPLKYSLTYTVRNRKDTDRFLKRIKKRFYSLCYTRFGFYCLRFLKKIKVFEVHE